MDILTVATQWAKDEIFSSKLFILAAILFVAIAIGFWQLGKSEIARAYIIPFAVCGALLLIIGGGLTYNNYSRLNSFPKTYSENSNEFIKAEIERTESTITSTEKTIFVWIPILIIVAALLIIFVDKPVWRAACVTTIAFLITLLVVDSNSHSRIVGYDKALKEVQSAELNKKQ
ncbi:MAG: hypothetical protein R3Y38_08015 [Rikenellaceae bacterium]